MGTTSLQRLIHKPLTRTLAATPPSLPSHRGRRGRSLSRNNTWTHLDTAPDYTNNSRLDSPPEYAHARGIRDPRGYIHGRLVHTVMGRLEGGPITPLTD